MEGRARERAARDREVQHPTERDARRHPQPRVVRPSAARDGRPREQEPVDLPRHRRVVAEDPRRREAELQRETAGNDASRDDLAQSAVGVGGRIDEPGAGRVIDQLRQGRPCGERRLRVGGGVLENPPAHPGPGDVVAVDVGEQRAVGLDRLDVLSEQRGRERRELHLHGGVALEMEQLSTRGELPPRAWPQHEVARERRLDRAGAGRGEDFGGRRGPALRDLVQEEVARLAPLARSGRPRVGGAALERDDARGRPERLRQREVARAVAFGLVQEQVERDRARAGARDFRERRGELRARPRPAAAEVERGVVDVDEADRVGERLVARRLLEAPVEAASLGAFEQAGGVGRGARDREREARDRDGARVPRRIPPDLHAHRREDNGVDLPRRFIRGSSRRHAGVASCRGRKEEVE